MKKTQVKVVVFVFITILFSSCATALGGRVSECQKSKPLAGEPKRKIRTGAFVANFLLFWPGLIVDFATGAIYKPCNKIEKSNKRNSWNIKNEE